MRGNDLIVEAAIQLATAARHQQHHPGLHARSLPAPAVRSGNVAVSVAWWLRNEATRWVIHYADHYAASSDETAATSYANLLCREALLVADAVVAADQTTLTLN